MLVVGGATGDDLVEFLDWESRESWRKLGRLNRGRGMGSMVARQRHLSAELETFVS